MKEKEYPESSEERLRAREDEIARGELTKEKQERMLAVQDYFKQRKFIREAKERDNKRKK